LTGFTSCIDIDGTWKARASYTNPDQPRFRTLGESVGTNILDEQIKCLAADNVTVRTGAANCWPYWLEGANIVVGANLDGSEVK